jgi:CheY-like chemotaxis protein
LPLDHPAGRSPAATLIDSLADPALHVDAGGRVVGWNAAATERLGLDAGTAGTPVAELGPGADLDLAIRLPLADGSGGQLLAWRTGATDTVNDAVLLQRARVLERLAGSAWHELAQPLGGLRGFVTMLRLEGWATREIGIDLALVDEAALDAERLTRTFTDLARGSSRAVPLRAMVADLAELAGHLLADVVVTIDIPEDGPELETDPATLRLVVASLLVDEIEALGGPRDARGHLRWTLRDDLAPGGHSVTLVVEDDAQARAPGDLPFLRARKESGGGTRDHGRTADGGTHFELALPALGVAASRATAPGSHPRPGGAQRPVTVLVCDDEDTVRNLLVRILTRGGLRALPARSGAEALEVLGRDAVDVVMADHRMAGMSGPELHARVSERHPHLRARFVLMSGDAGDTDLVAFAEAAGLRVLAKPFEFASLPATLREVAGR